MKALLKKIITRIPECYRNEILAEIYKENLHRIFIATIFVAISEMIIYIFFRKSLLNTEEIVAAIVLFNIVFSPICYLIYKKINFTNPVSVKIAKIVMNSYILGMFFFCCTLSLLPQNDFANNNTYTMILFAMAALLCLPPWESLLISLVVYVIYFIVLPNYQSNFDIVIILRINALIMNVFAWGIGRMVFRMKVVSMTDKKMIESRNELLNEIAKRDSMTSLLNHENAYSRLRDEVAKASHFNNRISVVMVDIDNFKQINDRYGHQTGDEIIVSVAEIITDNCRIDDVIGRYGGEEFIIIMPETDLKGAVFLAERIRLIIASTDFKEEINVTISAGVCEYNGHSTEELIKQADELLYKAKNMGRNRVESLGLNKNN